MVGDRLGERTFALVVFFLQGATCWLTTSSAGATRRGLASGRLWPGCASFMKFIWFRIPRKPNAMGRRRSPSSARRLCSSLQRVRQPSSIFSAIQDKTADVAQTTSPKQVKRTKRTRATRSKHVGCLELYVRGATSLRASSAIFATSTITQWGHSAVHNCNIFARQDAELISDGQHSMFRS